MSRSSLVGGFELLKTIPGERIFQVQVADARAELQGSLMEDLLHHRLPPGDGDFPLAELMRVLAQIGGLTSVGIELFSDAFDALPAEQAGQRAGASLRALLAQVP